LPGEKSRRQSQQEFRTAIEMRCYLNLLSFLESGFNHLGVAPRPTQVSPSGPRYFGGTFLPFIEARRPLPPARGAIALPIDANWFSKVRRYSWSRCSTSRLSSTKDSKSIPARTIFARFAISRPFRSSVRLDGINIGAPQLSAPCKKTTLLAQRGVAIIRCHGPGGGAIGARLQACW
jgi:hypothetical protein